MIIYKIYNTKENYYNKKRENENKQLKIFLIMKLIIYYSDNINSEYIEKYK